MIAPKLEISPRQNNLRRHFRYQAEMSYHFIHLTGSDKEVALQGNIYVSGTKPFNNAMNAKLDDLVEQYQKNIKAALANTYPEAYRLFIEVLNKLQVLRDVLKGISMEELDIQSASSALSRNIKSTLDYYSLRENNRTEQILRDFEAKLNQITESTLEWLENCTPHKLYKGPVLSKLKIDHDMKDYIAKNDKVYTKLLQSFIDLYHFTLLLEKVYNKISRRQYVIIFPEHWSDHYLNVSPDGFAFYSKFLVEESDVLELYMRFNTSKTEVKSFETIHQKARVVRVEQLKGKEMYLIACEYIICLQNEEQLITHAIQAQEVKDAFVAKDQRV